MELHRTICSHIPKLRIEIKLRSFEYRGTSVLSHLLQTKLLLHNYQCIILKKLNKLLLQLKGNKNCLADVFVRCSCVRGSFLVSSWMYPWRAPLALCLLHMTKSMCIAVQLRKFFFHNSQLHNKRLLEKSQNPREIRTCSLPIARHKC